MDRIIHLLIYSVLSICLIPGFISCKQRGELKPIHYSGSYNRDFNDLNTVQLAEAKKIGITPITSTKEAGKAKRKMKKIETNDNYEVEKLTHSIPYLIPDAAELLDEIGKNFRDSLKVKNAPDYKIKVTSVTRMMSDVKKLRKSNINSSKNSAHLYGTTFDISWVRYTKTDKDDPIDLDNGQLKMVLASVLRDLKRENRCYVKHERKQGCFHITVRSKK